MSTATYPESKIATEIAGGDVLGTAQLARKITSPTSPGGIAPSTVVRWIRRGLPMPGGKRNRLEAVLRGKTYLTSMAAYRRFLSRMERHHPDSAPEVRTPTQRQRGHEQAMRELGAKGIA